ncbi:hypothetical protein [Tenacibaculum sp. C7A-26P2]|uniref:hypothetical protein n=1 Tax=Tenacibaculum sp. C7A-26P2 TaxID=3447504 RepID=UPI003F85C667
MSIINFIRLLIKNKIILIILPFLSGILTFCITENIPSNYSTHSIIYTGIGSDGSIQLDKSFNLFKTNIAFDNLINIIKSRKTQEELALRLLSHNIVNIQNNNDIKLEMIKEEINKTVPLNFLSSLKLELKTKRQVYLEFDTIKNIVFEKLKFMQNKTEKNFVHELLASDSKFFSLKSISNIRAYRVNSSDLVKILYENSDPSICKETLDILYEIIEKKYTEIKESNSKDIVEYFQNELKRSRKKLKSIEKELLSFNIKNNIINYYEQSKAVAIMKEDMTLDFFNTKGEFEGAKAKVSILEKKLKTIDSIKKKRNNVVEIKRILDKLKLELSLHEAKNSDTNVNLTKNKLISQNKKLKENIEELFRLENTIEGIPIKTVLDEWLEKSVEVQNIKAKFKTVGDRNNNYDQQFKRYAPAGANLKKIEREFKIAEQEYLEILHGLNLAKLKAQDSKIASKLKLVAPSFYPFKALPSGRSFLIIGAVILSLILIISSIFLSDFFDNTLKNVQNTSKVIKIPVIGMFPKIYINHGKIGFNGIIKKLSDLAIRGINEQMLSVNKEYKKTLIISVISTRKQEGKTVVIANIAERLKSNKKSTIITNHSREYIKLKYQKKYNVNTVLGYPDSRPDYNDPALENPIYRFDENEYIVPTPKDEGINKHRYHSIVKQLIKKPGVDYLIIEHPNLLENSYSRDIINKSDLILLVCRANRVWQDADENAIKSIKNDLDNKIFSFVNGTEINEVEYLLGEIKKNQSIFRKRIKNFFRLQFNSSSKI